MMKRRGEKVVGMVCGGISPPEEDGERRDRPSLAVMRREELKLRLCK